MQAVARTDDLTRVRAVLETDRQWSAFALADLSPEHRGYCEWYLPDGTNAGTNAVILVYRGFEPPLFFALGAVADVMTMMPEVSSQPQFYVSVRDGLLDQLARSGYHVHDAKTLYRMVLRSDIRTLAKDSRAERLGPGDYGQLTRLYEDGEASGERPPFFQQSSLDSGVYFGVRENGALVAAAGTLVYAQEESVACVGNVYVRRDSRSRGLASAVTSAVAGELLERGISTIALNVRSDNLAAVRVYERLGFARYCEYQEALVAHYLSVTV
jgi:GNAT superfamily N-acetyltransferase